VAAWALNDAPVAPLLFVATTTSEHRTESFKEPGRNHSAPVAPLLFVATTTPEHRTESFKEPGRNHSAPVAPLLFVATTTPEHRTESFKEPGRSHSAPIAPLLFVAERGYLNTAQKVLRNPGAITQRPSHRSCSSRCDPLGPSPCERERDCLSERCPGCGCLDTGVILVQTMIRRALFR
jgi:hypothetical protein